ncbi:hypothetical protein DYB37_010103, partial [Aphanomyces astaci]
QGDVITVALDLDRGTLSFARNGESFGVGVDNLPSQDQGGYFPAISMYNKDDQVTFLPHDEATTGSKGAKSGIASIMRKVEAFQRLQTLWTRQEPPLDVYSAWVLWTNGQLKYVVGADGNAVAVDVTDNACTPFGLQPCDVVFTPKGMCTVLGVAHHLLWYALESHNQPTGQSGHVLAHWNVQTCRDMLSREHEFPITRHHRTHHSHDANGQAETPICDIVSYDDFAARQRSWTPAMDEALIARLHGLAQLNRVDSMFHLTAKDIVHALEKHGLDGMSAMDCLCRTGVFHASNQLLHAVLPDLRRQFTAPSTSVYSTSVQPRAFRVVCEDMPDPTASFLYALREAAREVQSPRVPLFVPVATYSSPVNPTRKLATMVNPLEKEVTLFEGVGRIMGIAWRCDVSMPWLFGPIVWKYLTGECITLADWQEGGGVDGVSATTGTKSLVDTALAMSSWTQEDFDMHQIPRCAVEDAATDIVSADQRHFCRFLSGHDGGNMSMLRLDIHLCPPMMQQPPSMPLSSCEDSNDHMMTKYGYPHVERDLPSDDDLTTPVRLYVPAYASVEMLQKKLHLAMTHHTDQTPLM